MALESINPATGEVLARFEEDGGRAVEAKLTAARAAFDRWRRTAFSKRAALMVELAVHLRAERDRYAALTTTEMGKPIVEAEAEIDKCAWAAEYFAEHAESMLAPRAIPSTAALSYVQCQPVGVVLEIMPWNFPFWQAIRAAIPILMGGNVALLKHASNVPQCALAIESIFRQAGFPDAVFQTLLVPSSGVESLINDERVASVTLTGSDVAGAKVARIAGYALKKCVLELGGSDPFIVLEDADVEKAASVGCRARNQNTGQSCIAAKRFIVHGSIADEWERRFCENVAALRLGDPMDRAVDRPGFYFQPTVVTQARREMAVFREETFGPLAAVIRVADEEEAIRLANDSKYGLGASVWTDTDRGQKLASRLEAGMVFVNGMVASDPRLPFGGVKRSGIGRELSEFGIREFQSLQTVWVGAS